MTAASISAQHWSISVLLGGTNDARLHGKNPLALRRSGLSAAVECAHVAPVYRLAHLRLA